MKQLFLTLTLTVATFQTAHATPSTYELIKCQGKTETGKLIQVALYSNTEESMWKAYSTAFVTLGNQEIAQEIQNILIGNSWMEEGDLDLKTYDTLEESNSEFEFHGAKVLGANSGTATIRVGVDVAKNLTCTFE